MEYNKKDSIFLNKEGFTLIEVLIAIAILSFLMTAMYQIIDSSATTNDRVTSEDRERLNLEIGLMRVQRDLELIHSPLYFDSSKIEDNKLFANTYNSSKSTTNQGTTGSSQSQTQSQSQAQQSNAPVLTTHLYQNKNYDNLSAGNIPIPIIINEEKGSLVFMTSANRRLIKNSKQSNLIWVRYRVASTQTEGVDEEDQNKEAPYSLTRTIISQNLYDTELDWEKAKEYAVINNLRDFYFEFYSPEKEAFVASLKELNELRNTPRLIRMTLDYVSKNGDEYKIQRTVRVLWPEFNAQEDLKEKYETTKK